MDPTNAACDSSRKLAGGFLFNGHRLFVIANHFNSENGDDPLLGRYQPPNFSSETRRLQQANVAKGFVDSLLAIDAKAEVVVLGDLNDFQFSAPLTALKGSALVVLMEAIPQAERYSYVYDGNSETLDQILVINGLDAYHPSYDSVHVNAEFAARVSDHDPQVMRVTLLPPLYLPFIAQ